MSTISDLNKKREKIEEQKKESQARKDVFKLSDMARKMAQKSPVHLITVETSNHKVFARVNNRKIRMKGFPLCYGFAMDFLVRIMRNEGFHIESETASKIVFSDRN